MGHIPAKYNYNASFPKPTNAVAWTNIYSQTVQKQMDKTIEKSRKELENAITPEALKGKKGVPAIFYVHGGGFYFPLSRDGLYEMAVYAEKLGARAFIPDYTSSEVKPFPVPFTDCVSAFEYVTENADNLGIAADSILLYGDSAGGCIVSGLSQYIRDHGEPAPAGVMLVYPAEDCSTDFESKKQPWRSLSMAASSFSVFCSLRLTRVPQ